jgi:hypothetical protein
MDQAHSNCDEPARVIANLARIALSSERRLQRLERMFRGTAALFLLTLVLALYALSQVFGAAPVQAQAQPLAQQPIQQRGWPHVAPEPIPPPLRRGPVAEEPLPPAAAFRARIEELRHHAGHAALEDLNPGHALAVLLQDLHDVLRETREMLAVMPQMGQDMRFIAGTMEAMDHKMTGVPVMAEEMRRLNTNIDIMTTSIDSTMGRMGRMMPYAW